MKNINDPIVIEKLTSKEVDYNVLCAGFPCTPFSKAGTMKGLKHKDGKLFNRVIEIIEKYNNNHKDNEISNFYYFLHTFLNF